MLLYFDRDIGLRVHSASIDLVFLGNRQGLFPACASNCNFFSQRKLGLEMPPHAAPQNHAELKHSFDNQGPNKILFTELAAKSILPKWPERESLDELQKTRSQI